MLEISTDVSLVKCYPMLSHEARQGKIISLTYAREEPIRVAKVKDNIWLPLR